MGRISCATIATGTWLRTPSLMQRATTVTEGITLRYFLRRRKYADGWKREDGCGGG